MRTPRYLLIVTTAFLMLLGACGNDGGQGLPLLCTWWYDTVAPMTAKYYKVTAVDESGNESAFSEVFGLYNNRGGRSGPENPVGQ
jgi:hypothetical protein